MTVKEIITCVALLIGAVAIGTGIAWLLPWPSRLFLGLVVAGWYYFFARWVLRRIERN